MKMKKSMNYLPLLAFVLAAFAGMAFNEAEVFTPEYGSDGVDWYDVTNKTEGIDYFCDKDEDACTRDMPSSSGNELQKGLFVPGENLEPID